MDPIRVLIVDDHQIMIEGLKSLLEAETDIEFAGGANAMAEAFDFLQKNPVDVVLMDINMPGGSGIEATAKIRDLHPEIRIVALTMYDDISVISRMVQAVASGYVIKRTRLHEVIEANRAVHNNERYLGAYTQQIIMDNMGSLQEIPETRDESKSILSTREIEVLQLIAKEYRNEQIAEKLFISERTVEAHRRNIFIKTKTKTIVGLLKYAISKGLIPVE
ncbi:MAG: response regulator [Bacteroidales bacterium]